VKALLPSQISRAALSNHPDELVTAPQVHERGYAPPAHAAPDRSQFGANRLAHQPARNAAVNVESRLA
jgi:hypothetical protein